MLQEKQLLKDSPEHFFAARMDKYFPTSFWWSLSVLLPYWEEIYSLVMGSFSAPRALQLLVTTEEPITPSIERDQKLWEDKINPQDQGIPERAHHAEPVIIVLRDPTQFPNRKHYPLRREAREGLQPLRNKFLACGLLVPTSPPCNTPILSVMKKDETW